MFIADISPGSVLVIGVFVRYLNCYDERMKSVWLYVLCMQNHMDSPHTNSIFGNQFHTSHSWQPYLSCHMVHRLHMHTLYTVSNITL